MRHRILLAALSLLFASESVVAVPIFTQVSAGPATTSGWNSNLPASNHSRQQIADDFLLGSGATVTQVDWYGQTHLGGAPFAPGAVVPFRIRFFADAAGEPGLNPFFDTTLNVTAQAAPGHGTIFGDPNLFWSANIAGPALSAGTTYWLSVLEAGPGTVGTWAWARNPQLAASAFSRNGDGVSWIGPDESVAYTLHSVPEPAIMALFALGLAGLGFTRRQRS